MISHLLVLLLLPILVYGDSAISSQPSAEGYAVISSKMLYDKFLTPFLSRCRAYPFYEQYQRMIIKYNTYEKFLVYTMDQNDLFSDGISGLVNAFLFALREDRLLVVKGRSDSDVNNALNFMRPFNENIEVKTNHSDIYAYFMQFTQTKSTALKVKSIACTSDNCINENMRDVDIIEFSSSKSLVCSWMKSNETKTSLKSTLFNDVLMMDNRKGMEQHQIDQHYISRDFHHLEIAGCALRMVLWPTTNFWLTVSRNYNKQVKAAIGASTDVNKPTSIQQSHHFHAIANSRHFTLVNNTLLPDYKERTAEWMKKQRENDFLQSRNPTYHKTVHENLLKSTFLSNPTLYLPRRIFFQLSVHYQCADKGIESNSGNLEKSCKVASDKYTEAISSDVDNPISLASCANEILTKFIDTNYYPPNFLPGTTVSEGAQSNSTRPRRNHGKVFHNLHRRKAALPMLLHLSSDATESVEQMLEVNDNFPFTLASSKALGCNGNLKCVENKLVEFIMLSMSDVILANNNQQNSFSFFATVYSLKKNILYDARNCGVVIHDQRLSTTSNEHWQC